MWQRFLLCKHIEDIIIDINNGNLIIEFITDGNINMKEINEYYFTKKVPAMFHGTGDCFASSFLGHSLKVIH